MKTTVVLMEFENCPAASVHLNYLDRRLRREIVINTADGTLKADLVSCSIEQNGKTMHYKTSRNQTYLDQHKAILSGQTQNSCSLNEGWEIVRLINAIEHAVEYGCWVSNE